ncbi:Splicing factor ESS-2-like protein [Picochlorum sp. SENEW3]|nr:Splicing factor ESS-2-like protein [Picochlorum sp. SENEW3]WPT14563.1 Splicing factor ESS-2-like protein [Picochlorum sp. SENEW3]
MTTPSYQDEKGIVEREAGAERQLQQSSRHAGRRREIILDEDDWIAAMEGIIERDFFPDLKTLRERVEGLERDTPGQILSFSQERGAAGSWEPTPYEPDLTEAGTSERAPKLTLDQFLSRYTSEDNASFRDILDRSNAVRREKFKHLLKPPNPCDQKKTTERLTDGYGTTGQGEDKMIGWKYKPVNMLMYDGSSRKSLAYSSSEKPRKVQNGVNHKATHAHVDTSGGIVYGSREGGTSTSQAEAAPREYSIMATPVIEPGVDATPLMTWGKIDATPQRLDHDNASGFKVQQTPTREQLAHSLGGKASKAINKRSGHGTSHAAKLVSRALSQRGSATPMSPAARRLAGHITKKRDTDDALRASYSAGHKRRR